MRIIIAEGGKRPYEAELEHDLKVCAAVLVAILRLSTSQEDETQP